jgi:hypothetical protein
MQWKGPGCEGTPTHDQQPCEIRGTMSWQLCGMKSTTEIVRSSINSVHLPIVMQVKKSILKAIIWFTNNYYL